MLGQGHVRLQVVGGIGRGVGRNLVAFDEGSRIAHNDVPSWDTLAGTVADDEHLGGGQVLQGRQCPLRPAFLHHH